MKSCRTSLHKRNFYKARNSSELTGFSCFLWLFTFYVSLKNCVCFYESCLVVQFCVLSCFSCVRLFMTPWTVAHQALLSMGFSKQEYWSGLLCPPPGDLPDPGIESVSLMSPALAGGFFLPQAPPGKFYPSLNYHFFLFFFSIGRYLLYNIALVSAVRQHELATGIHMSPPSWTSLPSPTPSHPSRFNRALGWAPCVTHKSPLAIILHRVMYMFPFYSLNLWCSLPPILCPRVCSLCLWSPLLPCK